MQTNEPEDYEIPSIVKETLLDGGGGGLAALFFATKTTKLFQTSLVYDCEISNKKFPFS